MALRKEEPYKGLTGDYWRLGNVNIDLRTGRCQVRMDLYATITTRQADINNILKTRDLTFVLTTDPIRSDLYLLIKQDAYFIEAVDC